VGAGFLWPSRCTQLDFVSIFQYCKKNDICCAQDNVAVMEHQAEVVRLAALNGPSRSASQRTATLLSLSRGASANSASHASQQQRKLEQRQAVAQKAAHSDGDNISRYDNQDQEDDEDDAATSANPTRLHDDDDDDDLYTPTVEKGVFRNPLFAKMSK
jgi:hypothetical protein